MNAKINQLLANINEQINFIDLEIDNPIIKCEKAIEVILASIANLKKVVLKSNFKSEQEEIHFFKDIKTQFTSRLIYYNAVYNIKMKKPNGGKDQTRKAP